MLLLNVNSLKKEFSADTLFDDVSFGVYDKDKIGLIGVNGAGKSTLFNIITGNADADGGEINKSKNLTVGYLEQYADLSSQKTIEEEMLGAFAELVETEKRLADIRLELETGSSENMQSLVKEQARLNESFAAHDGFFYRSKIKSTLNGLGFPDEEFSLKMASLSGGQKTRVSLAKILLSDAKLLLLDEPTNHLDVSSVEWLETFLANSERAFIVISHDRYFLDKVTNKTFAMENGRLHEYNGNYSIYMELVAEERKTQQRSYENTMREINRLEAVVTQQRRWNREKNIKTAESKEKVIDRLKENLVVPQSEVDEISFSFKECGLGGQDVLTCEAVGKTFGGKRIFKNADCLIKKGERVFLLGDNGCGKTTLLKIVTGDLGEYEGTIKIGSNIFIGYYDQTQENLSPGKTIFDEVYDEYPQLSQTTIRNALAAFLFCGDDVFKIIGTLSGGEKARVALTKLMLKKTNFLILDEPTNHLDIESREALESALRDYGGTMLIVSHDRYFINALADRVLYMKESGLENYSGNYDYFRDKQREEEENAAGAENSEKQVSQGALDYNEQKRRAAKIRKAKNDFAKTEKEISQKEDKVNVLKKQLEDPQIAGDYEKATEISQELAGLEEKLNDLLERWTELNDEIAEDEE